MLGPGQPPGPQPRLQLAGPLTEVRDVCDEKWLPWGITGRRPTDCRLCHVVAAALDVLWELHKVAGLAEVQLLPLEALSHCRPGEGRGGRVGAVSGSGVTRPWSWPKGLSCPALSGPALTWPRPHVHAPHLALGGTLIDGVLVQCAGAS